MASNGQDQDWEYQPLVNFNLDLPRTQGRLKFVVERRADEIQEEDVGDRDVDKRYEDDNVETTAGLRYLILSIKEWNLNADSGVALDREPEPYGRSRAWSSYDWGLIRILPSAEISWRPSRMWRSLYGLNFERYLSKPEWKFVFSNQLEWRMTAEQAEYVVGPSLIHQINQDISMTYSLKQHSLFEPVIRAVRYEFSVLYRQNLYDRWIFGNIRPFISYQRNRNFGPAPGIVLRLDFEFVAQDL